MQTNLSVNYETLVDLLYGNYSVPDDFVLLKSSLTFLGYYVRGHSHIRKTREHSERVRWRGGEGMG